jgi:hypothetical protein
MFCVFGRPPLRSSRNSQLAGDTPAASLDKLSLSTFTGRRQTSRFGCSPIDNLNSSGLPENLGHL